MVKEGKLVRGRKDGGGGKKETNERRNHWKYREHC